MNRLLASIFLVLFSSFCLATSSFDDAYLFDNLFPMTWYEKGIGATIFILNKICLEVCKKSDNYSVEVFDVMLGRCAFACFCIEKMYQTKQLLMNEDFNRFVKVLSLLESRLLDCQEKYDMMHDRVCCLQNMVKRMSDTLQGACNI